MVPAITLVKMEHRPMRTEKIRINVDGKVFEQTMRRPLVETVLSDPN